MSAKQFKKGNPEFNFFGNFYTFAQAYWNPEDSEQYHREVLAGCDKLWKTYCADKDGKPLPTISAKRIEAIIQAFALFEEHNFLNDFVRYSDRFSNTFTDDEWHDFYEEAKELLKTYCHDDSWESRKRESMIVDLLLIVDNECRRKQVEELRRK